LRNEREDIYNALLKKAMGYTADESVEEFSAEEEGLKLLKKKVTKKHVPPDVSALKVLLSLGSETSVSEMTDEELEKEKTRLLKLLKDCHEGREEEEDGD
jgi:hypothetical protein